MYFKKLEMVGFKSFFNKTTLRFEPGITAVVGPNGTGKSNIFDAIRWVLGEQSVKSLRGSDMQDVIFSGTDNKEPLSLAEVTVTFDNGNKFFNFAHDEVAITRRLFRSGESEYLLNKNIVRLKDVTDLLMGTGIGAESYSLVAQGKIDLILSARPEDRRLVFDEAAGITKYKSQKREATRKLEDTEQNLLRVNDIIAEVKRQINSLERQANKARRYKDAFEDLKSKETTLAALQKTELLKQKDEVIHQLKSLETAEAMLIDILKERESKITNRQSELQSLEENMMNVKNQILNLENLVVSSNERISFNKEKIIELTAARKYLQEQVQQLKNRLVSDEEKLNNVKEGYDGIKKNIEEKSVSLLEKETKIAGLAAAIKDSLETIARAKSSIMDLAARMAHIKNEISDYGAKLQVFLARKKRLEIEKAKVCEEKNITKVCLDSITQEVEGLKQTVNGSSLKISAIKTELEQEGVSLNNINIRISELEKERLTLESHKEFLEKLKTKYQDLGESLNATIYLDKLPQEFISGLVVKIKNHEAGQLKLSGEAKPIELDTRKITEKISHLEGELNILKDNKASKEAQISELNKSLLSLQEELRSQEIALSSKEVSRLTTLEQFNKLEQEEEVIGMELADTHKEISVLENNLAVAQSSLAQLNRQHTETENTIGQEEEKISANGRAREELLVAITRSKAEIDALNKRISLDAATLRILEDTYNQDKNSLGNIQAQINDNENKKESFQGQIAQYQIKVIEHKQDLEKQKDSLKAIEDKYRQFLEGTNDVNTKIDADRKELEALKERLYELQMRNKDIDYKFASIKDKLMQAYRIDLEAIEQAAIAGDIDSLTRQIEELKSKVDSYGTVNLVAIEEYDELKKRYDFLTQQQTDLVTAKESLHEAILKINRTTRKMFLETFERVREEFRNYFRVLFNGGDAQVFLIDEHDPLESGIEIICRPPGKKLQNVLLLSGGEKSLSAIALIFAIFKVKPSPFCILDEIDAALDEANVDRFSRLLQDFAKTSQFIVITHNKKTIVNADVMYGITMEESGVSKIVSVKFAKESEPQPVAEPV